MKQVIRRVAVASLTVLGVLGLCTWIILSWIITRPPVYLPNNGQGPIELRPWPEHNAIYRETNFPYALSMEGAKGALRYVGALHTSDATEPQLVEIERLWADFKPTVALCEGRARMYRFATRRRSGELSESELTRILARRAGVPLYTLEPTYEAEVARLLDHFDARLVATYMIVRVYAAESGGQRQDRLALSLLRKRTDVKGLRDTFSTLAELDTYWQATFAGKPDWRELQNTEQVQLLLEVGNVSRQVRGEHMVRTLAELVNRGERVFAVVGASHVIRQEPALVRILGARTSGTQGT